MIKYFSHANLCLQPNLQVADKNGDFMNNKINKEHINELFKTINTHLLHDDVPSVFLSQLCNHPEIKQYPFDMILKLQSTKQSPIHHPEGSVWNHTLLVVDEAAKRKSESKDAEVFMWAAFLHDIGKPPTTRIRKGKITSYDHEKVGANLAKDFLSEFTDDGFFIENVCSLIQYHMQILFVNNDLPFAQINEMKQNADINEIALLGLCDRLGRTGANQSTEKNNIELFIRKCKDVKQERKQNGKSRNEKTRS